jgi:hypothetical protein
VVAQHEDTVGSPYDPRGQTSWMRFPFLLQDDIDAQRWEFLLERGIPSRMV